MSCMRACQGDLPTESRVSKANATIESRKSGGAKTTAAFPNDRSTAAVGAVDVVAPSNKWQQTGNGKGVKSEGHPQQPGFPQQPTQQTQFTFVGDVVPCCYNKLIFFDDQFCVYEI